MNCLVSKWSLVSILVGVLWSSPASADPGDDLVRSQLDLGISIGPTGFARPEELKPGYEGRFEFPLGGMVRARYTHAMTPRIGVSTMVQGLIADEQREESTHFAGLAGMTYATQRHTQLSVLVGTARTVHNDTDYTQVGDGYFRGVSYTDLRARAGLELVPGSFVFRLALTLFGVVAADTRELDWTWEGSGVGVEFETEIGARFSDSVELTLSFATSNVGHTFSGHPVGDPDSRQRVDTSFDSVLSGLRVGIAFSFD